MNTQYTYTTWTELTQYIHVTFLWHTVLNFGYSHCLILTSSYFMRHAHWGCQNIPWHTVVTLPDAEPILLAHTDRTYLFILKLWLLCSAKSELKIRGSVTATIWRSATVQQQGSSTPGPTTGCFWLNKDFLLSSEVPTDAYIGAKFTLCARRKLPLFGLKVHLTYVCAAWGLFLIKSDTLTLHQAGKLHKDVLGFT